MLKKLLESFLFKVKGLLSQHDALHMWELAELKQKSLKGEIVSSQFGEAERDKDSETEEQDHPGEDPPNEEENEAHSQDLLFIQDELNQDEPVDEEVQEDEESLELTLKKEKSESLFLDNDSNGFLD